MKNTIIHTHLMGMLCIALMLFAGCTKKGLEDFRFSFPQGSESTVIIGNDYASITTNVIYISCVGNFLSGEMRFYTMGVPDGVYMRIDAFSLVDSASNTYAATCHYSAYSGVTPGKYDYTIIGRHDKLGERSVSGTIYVKTPETSTYQVGNTSDINITRGGKSIQAKWNIQSPSGDWNNKIVSVSISELPPGVTANITPEKALVPYTCTGTFNADCSTTPGTYPITITAFSDGVPDKIYKCNLIISEIAQTECSSDWTGIKGFTIDKTPGGASSGSVTITAVTGHTNRLQFNMPGGMSFYADIRCCDNTLAIPYQPTGDTGNTTIEGAGNFNAQSMTLQYTLSQGSLTTTCSTVIDK